MEIVGSVASVISILELAAKVASSCHKYLVAVKDAEKDIVRLHNETQSLEEILKKVHDRNTQKTGATLVSSPAMSRCLNDCFIQLSSLNEKLQPLKATKWMSKLKLRELKWPFETSEVNKIIGYLQGYKQSISLALQLDQMQFAVPATLVTATDRFFQVKQWSILTPSSTLRSFLSPMELISIPSWTSWMPDATRKLESNYTKASETGQIIRTASASSS